MRKKERLLRLLKKYIKGTANAEEAAFVEAYYDHFGEKELPIEEGTEERLLTGIDTRIVEMERFTAKRNRKAWIAMTAAAATVLFFIGLGWLHYHGQKAGKQPVAVHDLSPGRAGALLQFADRRPSILLDTARDGALGAGVTKTAAKVSVADYDAEAITYATLSTPNARTYQLVLPDGSTVWLNAASSVRFPTKFTGKDRVVEISGEVDIRVAPDKEHPFRVRAGQREWQVLGTEFDINAYADEPVVRTTLIEGAVKTEGVVLKPGQQSVVRQSDNAVTVLNNINTDDVVAWRNGLFVFNDKTDLPTVMRTIARWYDVRVEYEGSVPTVELGGKISRNSSASEVLQILSYSTNIQFHIEPGKIVVLGH